MELIDLSQDRFRCFCSKSIDNLHSLHTNLGNCLPIILANFFYEIGLMFALKSVLIKQRVASCTGGVAGLQRKWRVIEFFKKILLSSAWFLRQCYFIKCI